MAAARAPAGVWPTLLLVCACRSAPADAPGEGDGGDPLGTSGTSGATETTLSSPGECERSLDCAEDSPHCVAPYDPGLGTIGDGACVPACVSAGDLARACLDDAACCSGLQCNPVDGFCSAPPEETTSSTGTDTGTGSDESSSSGTAGSSSSGTAGSTG